MRRLLWFVLCFVCHFSFSQTRKADSLSNTLLAHPEEDTTRVNILNQLAFEFQFHTPGKAVNYGLEAKDLAHRLKYGKGEAMANRFLGLAFWVQSDYAIALDFFLKSLRIADSLKLIQTQADLNGNIGLVYNGMGDYQRALTYFNSSIELQRQLKNAKREVVMLNNKGDCYRFLNKYDSALIFYNESLRLGEPMSYLVETNKRNIGNVLEAMGRPNEAIAFYLAAKAISDRYHDLRERSQIRKSLASFYLSQNKVDAAQAEALSALEISKKGNYRSIMRDCFEMLYKISNSKKEFPAALDYFKKYTLYKDSIQNLTEASSIATLQLDFELKRKQSEIENLGKIHNEKMKFKNLIIVCSVFGIALLLFLLLSVVRNFRIQKKLNLELADKNVEINKKREELIAQHNEVLTLNEEIQSQQDEVIAQRDALLDHNNRIEALHQMLRNANQNLEKAVAERTTELKEQNRRLEEYAFINAHKLRAPVANILGLIEVLELKHLEDERNQLLDHLKKSSWELDQVIRSIGKTIREGVNSKEKGETV